MSFGLEVCDLMLTPSPVSPFSGITKHTGFMIYGFRSYSRTLEKKTNLYLHIEKSSIEGFHEKYFHINSTFV